MLPPGEYKQGVAWTGDNDFAFCKITLVLVLFNQSILLPPMRSDIEGYLFGLLIL